MDLDRLIAELYAERMRLDAAITALERAIVVGRKRRGRPPERLSQVRTDEGGEPGARKKGELSNK
jgi:hypothetical protein